MNIKSFNNFEKIEWSVGKKTFNEIIRNEMKLYAIGYNE
jgi:hypothetical protein